MLKYEGHPQSILLGLGAGLVLFAVIKGWHKIFYWDKGWHNTFYWDKGLAQCILLR